MLDKIRKFADSISADQTLLLKEKLGDAYPSFHMLMLSDTDEKSEERMREFKSEVTKIDLPQLLELHSELTDEQRSILDELL